MCDHPRILVIDDEIGVAGSKDLRRFLVDAGARTDGDRPAPDYPYAFEFCTGGVGAGTFSVAAVLERVRAGWNDPTHGPWALILLDVRFGAHPAFGYDVLDAIRAAPDLGADVPVIMLTREENTRSDAAHGDASGFLAKDTVTREAVENRVFREGLIPYAAPLSDQKGHLLGRSVAFLKMLRAIRRTVRDGTIRQLCLLGESGVGKERLAVYAHDVSRGPQALFLHEFADSSNPHLQVGKIFGSWPGAYNDAPRDGRPGVFERAHGGTLFLDELQNLSPESQERLLEVRPMGSRNTRVVSRYGTAPLSEPAVLNRCRPHIRGRLDGATGRITVDVGMITASNTRLDDPAERKACGFRDDLWAGLQPFVVVPNLNERRGDVPVLFRELLKSSLGREDVNVDADVFAVLERIDWSLHGNIRGLKRAAEHAALRYGDFELVTPKQLPMFEPPPVATPAPGGRVAPVSPPAEPSISGPEPKIARFPAELVARYRRDLEALAAVLVQTADPTKPPGANSRPGTALRHLLLRPVSGADIERLIQKLFFAPVFRPPKALSAVLKEHGLDDVQAWAATHPVLKEFAERARGSRDDNDD